MINYILAPWQPVNGSIESVSVKLASNNPFWLETLKYLDAITDKDFILSNAGDYQLTITEGDMEPGIAANCDAWDNDLYNGLFNVVVDPSHISKQDYYGYVARHELGHVMGLQHPFIYSDEPYTNDTVMSYTPDSYYYSDLDKAALIYVNGIEDDVPQVYRFYNKLIGSHFYTADANEAFNVATTMYDAFSFDGTAWEQQEGTIALHRYYNYVTGEHFMTTDTSEITPDHLYFTYEGVVFNVPSDGDPVYRYLNELNGAHLYTTDLSEAPEHYLYEGVGFYV